jgi:hypothetical protein
MAPTPHQKASQISPIFISDKVTLHVSREKDKEVALVDAGWDDAKAVQPDGCGQARRGWKGGSYPLAGGSDDPPQKPRPPSGPPPVFPAMGADRRRRPRPLRSLEESRGWSRRAEQWWCKQLDAIEGQL